MQSLSFKHAGTKEAFISVIYFCLMEISGSQVLVSFALEKELPAMAFSLVAEEVRLDSVAALFFLFMSVIFCFQR